MRGFALVVAAGLVMAGNAQGAPRILWGVDGGGGNTGASLYQIDSSNGSASSIGAVGVGITGLAVDPTTGTLYGVSNSGTRGLYQINRSTGAGTLIGAFNPSSTIADITFDASGQLYGWAEGPDDLARIDKATGAVTIVADSGLNTFGSGIAFCGATLFYAGFGANGALYTIDPATGLGTAGPTLSGAPFPTGAISALACALDGTLFGSNLDFSAGNPTDLISISTGNGNINDIGSTVARLDALAIDEVALDLEVIPTAAVTGQTLSFNATVRATSPASVSWSFGDGGTATGPSATHAYAAAGAYTVTVTATATGPVSVTQSITVSIKAPATGTRQILWGVDGSGFATFNKTPRLYRIDPANGAATPVGATGIQLTGIAIHPTTHTMYGVPGGCDPVNCQALNKLVTVDRLTGATTVVATLNNPVTSSTFNVLADIAFDAGGTLYGWNEDTDDLYTVDLTTGAVTKIAESSNGTYGSGLAFDQTGALFLAGHGNTGNLDALNPATGLATHLGLLTGATGPSGSAISAMTARADGTLFAVELDDAASSSNDRAANLITIDKASRAVTTIGPTVHRLDAIEFEPVTAPLIASATATPSVVGTGQAVTFTASATSQSGLGLSYAWDFGDGSAPGAGNPATHSYSASGTYTVTLTVTDESTGTATRTVSVIVAQPLTVKKFLVVLNFAKAGRDSIAISGSVAFPSGFNPANAALSIDVGGVTASATLNRKGRASGAAFKKTGKFKGRLKNGSFAAQLADEGLTNETVSRKSVTVAILLNVGGNYYYAQRTASYSAKAGKKGKAK